MLKLDNFGVEISLLWKRWTNDESEWEICWEKIIHFENSNIFPGKHDAERKTNRRRRSHKVLLAHLSQWSHKRNWVSLRKDVAKKNCGTEKQMGENEEMKRVTNWAASHALNSTETWSVKECLFSAAAVVVGWIHSKIVWWQNREHMRLEHIGRNGLPANGRRYNILRKHFLGTKCQILWHKTQNTWKLVCFFPVLMMKKICEFFSCSSVWLEWTVSMNQ